MHVSGAALVLRTRHRDARNPYGGYWDQQRTHAPESVRQIGRAYHLKRDGNLETQVGDTDHKAYTRATQQRCTRRRAQKLTVRGLGNGGI